MSIFANIYAVIFIYKRIAPNSHKNKSIENAAESVSSLKLDFFVQ